MAEYRYLPVRSITRNSIYFFNKILSILTNDDGSLVEAHIRSNSTCKASLERLAVNAKVATVLGLIPASS
jgi:hypothetical protein